MLILSRRWIALLLALLLAVPASAHPVPFSYLEIDVRDDGIEGRVRAHLVDLAPMVGVDDPGDLLRAEVLNPQRESIQRHLVSRMELGGADVGRIEWGRVMIVDESEALEFRFSVPGAPPPALALKAHFFDTDPVHQTFVTVYESGSYRQQFIFSANSDPKTFYRGTTAGTLEVVKTFVPAGVHHILIGPDHVLFVVGLLLLGGRLRKLVLIVTAFTIGHSVTLSLAALNIYSPPVWLVEPAIALSIVVVGVDNILQRQQQGRDFRAAAALVFGLVHGFGFAFVLREFGLPQEALGWSLFSFNVGVELGQVAIVLVVASALGAIRSRFPSTDKWIVIGGSCVVIAAGTYWFVERVFFGG